MKYTIEGFQQNELLNMELDCIDAVIIRYIVDFYLTSKMKKTVIMDKEFFWINYQTVIDSIPIIHIENKIALVRRFKKYVECGLLEHECLKICGTYSYYRFTEKLDPLLLDSKCPSYFLVKPLSLLSENKDSSIKDSSINNDSIKDIIHKVVTYLNAKAEKNFKTTSHNSEHINARLKEGYILDDFKMVIDIKVSQWKGDIKMKSFLRPDTLFAPSHFDTYLNENPEYTRKHIKKLRCPDCHDEIDPPENYCLTCRQTVAKERIVYDK